MDRHEYFMQEALKEAKEATKHKDIPVGAIIVKDKKIIARAHNQVELLKDPTAHAEMIAITQATSALGNKFLIDADIYVTLEPCAMCAGALILARARRIFLATKDEKTGACGSVFDIVNDLRLNHQIKVIYGLKEQESKKILQDFFKNLRT